MLTQLRRRREQKTDYRKRLGLVKSDRVRLVIRKSLDNIRVQFVEYKPSGDSTLASAVSSELKKLGWSNSSGNLPASYLTGYLAGKKALNKNIKDAILDMGLQTSTKGSRIYAALKGVLDAGVNIPHSKEILPEEKRIKGTHINEHISKHLDDVKRKIEAS